MSGRFFTQRTMDVIRHEERVLNSIAKRREKPGYPVLYAWGCGCCFGFIQDHVPPPPQPEKKIVKKLSNKEEKNKYEKWLQIAAIHSD
jgi:hypothetical protein